MGYYKVLLGLSALLGGCAPGWHMPPVAIAAGPFSIAIGGGMARGAPMYYRSPQVHQRMHYQQQGMVHRPPPLRYYQQPNYYASQPRYYQQPNYYANQPRYYQ